MGILYLVRHGQASLGADDYDNLSTLGQRQSLRLGQYFAAKGLQFEAVMTGSLKRHAQTWDWIQNGMDGGVGGIGGEGALGHGAAPKASVWPGLNEYDSEAVIATVRTGPPIPPTTPEGYREYFSLLREGLRQWANGSVAPVGMPSYSDFAQGMVAALDHVRAHHAGKVLLVSSGGPIATAVALTVGARPEGFVELNMRLRNTAISELVFTRKRHALLTFNTMPHLNSPAFLDWLTYA